MHLTKDKHHVLKIVVAIAILFAAVFILVNTEKAASAHTQRHSTGMQTEGEGTFSNQLLLHEIQLQMAETAKDVGAYEEAESSGQYALTVILLLALLSQCTGARTYLTASYLLENQIITRILKFIQKIDGKKERTSYCV